MLGDFEITHGECQHSFFLGCKQCNECWVTAELKEYNKELQAQEEAELEAWIRAIEEEAQQMGW